MNRTLLMQLLTQIPPQKLGELIAKMRDKENAVKPMYAPPRSPKFQPGPMDLLTQKPIQGPIRGAY